MKSERAADLSLTRELTERQAEQKWVEDQRAEYLRRANSQPDKAPCASAGEGWRGKLHFGVRRH